jgi:hypothetical protein
MLPSFLDSTYKRYKTDTSTFVRWLSETAQKCGYTSIAVEVKSIATPAAAKSARLKGKARKDAKKAEQSNLSTPSPAFNGAENPKDYCIVDLKELMPLATAIVNSKKPSFTVPSEIIRAHLRAVSARKRCTSYFTSKTADSETAKSNYGHAYFTSLMEEAIRTLQLLFAKSVGGDD